MVISMTGTLAPAPDRRFSIPDRSGQMTANTAHLVRYGAVGLATLPSPKRLPGTPGRMTKGIVQRRRRSSDRNALRSARGPRPGLHCRGRCWVVQCGTCRRTRPADTGGFRQADDVARTRDLRLGKHSALGRLQRLWAIEFAREKLRGSELLGSGHRSGHAFTMTHASRHYATHTEADRPRVREAASGPWARRRRCAETAKCLRTASRRQRRCQARIDAGRPARATIEMSPFRSRGMTRPQC